MPKRQAITTELQHAIIRAYVGSGGSVTHTMQAVGCSTNAVGRYVGLWRTGKLIVPGYDPNEAQVNTKSLKQENAELRHELEEARKLADMFKFVKEAKVEIPAWTMRTRTGTKAAIPTAFLSDVHLDEVVDPREVNYVNAYDREIAALRLNNFFHHTIEIADDYLQGLKYEGIVLPLGGDIFSGIIHEELVETNAGTIFESLLHWAEPICAGILLFRDAFGRVFLPCVAGNHGRRQRKPHAKHRAQDNFDWFFYHLLRKLLAKEKGIEFAIAESADQPYRVFNTRYLLTHGDQFRGGSGIAGMLSPLMLGDARKRQREAAVKRNYDYLVMGHWHQLAFVRGMIINGSSKGYDEYAFVSNFQFEPPRQAFWVTDPRHGVTITAPIHVIDASEIYTAESGHQATATMGTI
jgi:transposase-like protein